MTHIETSRVNEMLGLQIGMVRQAAAKLQSDRLEELDSTIEELQDAVNALRDMLKSLPRKM